MICDLSSLPEGTIGVKWIGKPILTSVQNTRNHIAYPVLMKYLALGEHDHATVIRGAAKASNAKATTYSWYLDTEAGWTLTRFAINHPRVYQACLQLAVSDIRLTGCIGARVGTNVEMLPPFASADFSTIVYWNAHEAKVADVDPRKPVNLHTLFDKDWKYSLWVQLLAIEGEEWVKLIEMPNGPTAAPPFDSTVPDTDMDTDEHMSPPRRPKEGTSTPDAPDDNPHGPDGPSGPHNFKLSGQPVDFQTPMPHVPFHTPSPARMDEDDVDMVDGEHGELHRCRIQGNMLKGSARKERFTQQRRPHSPE